MDRCVCKMVHETIVVYGGQCEAETIEIEKCSKTIEDAVLTSQVGRQIALGCSDPVGFSETGQVRRL